MSRAHLAEIWDIGVEILLVFFDDQVAFVFDLLAVAPLDPAVPELEKDGVFAVPSFEIYGKPRSVLAEPEGPSTIKVQSTCAEQGRSSFEFLVVLLKDLQANVTLKVGFPRPRT